MKKKRFSLGLLILLLLGFYFSLPKQLFDDPYATLLLDRDGHLLSAKIARDQQWRFPEIDSVPQKLETCITLFEDEYFRYHPGVNPVSLARAIRQNWNAGKIKSGGSTLSMQVIRLSRKNPSRTYWEKVWEMVLALRLELSYSKDEILQLYTSHAPYGGNVVGAETASWRYFGRPLTNLSWSEHALLAVLPNSPSLIHLGRNRELLRAKRDRLLKKLLIRNEIDSMTYSLSLLEAIPAKPSPLPQHAYHLLERACNEGKEGTRVKSHIESDIQFAVNQKIDRFTRNLVQNEVHNACAMVVEVATGNVVAYTGNASIPQTRSRFVDLIQARRSSGSILKPFLYSKAVEEGIIHTSSLLKDVPISLDQFAPRNFNGKFDGVVRAEAALYRSLNVPATLLLRDYGLGIFHQDLVSLGYSGLKPNADHYGLTLILGGAEVSLWECAQAYSKQAHSLAQSSTDSSYSLQLWSDDQSEQTIASMDRGAWYLVTQSLTNVQRPGLSSDWRQYSSSRKLAWKTGTSFGFRDAWAVGYDPRYLVAVWVGNADGEGRPGLTGVSAAGPILFDICEVLPKGEWFEKPTEDLVDVELCKNSGYLATYYCPRVKAKGPKAGGLKTTCKYHQKVTLNFENELVFQDCWSGPMKDSVIFQLDPVAGYYYYPRHRSSYFRPQLAESCKSKQKQEAIGIIYPAPNSTLIIPTNLRGELEQIQLKAAHQQIDEKLFWHLDNQFIGITEGFHEIPVKIRAGKHTLTLIDEQGNQISCTFKAFES